MNDYKNQAAVWDWDGYDDSAEYEYWRGYAARFGKNVLLPMCAHGQAGAYLAQKGLNVLAFDITPEMVAEGNKRYGGVDGLKIITADLLNLNLDDKGFDFTYIAGYGDLHLFQSAEDIEKVFISLHKHLRSGGCLALEATLPSDKSWSYPKKIFHPRVPNYTDKKVWKENEGSYDADIKRQYINQTVYIEDEDGVNSFFQQICLQYYEWDVVYGLLEKNGFKIQGEYSNREGTPWKQGDRSWNVEAVKI
jgi:SAM-dependent methyltransferase